MAQPSSQDWEENQSIIRQYYLEDGFTLPRVMETMKQVHGFKAT
jgi:hypothetical protein